MKAHLNIYKPKKERLSFFVARIVLIRYDLKQLGILCAGIIFDDLKIYNLPFKKDNATLIGWYIT